MNPRPHFLESYGIDTSGIVGYGKPYRGLIRTGEQPITGTSLAGVLSGVSSIMTSTLVRVQPLGEAKDGKVLYIIETLNSVYMVQVMAA